MSKSHLYGCIDVDGRKRNKVVSETNRTEPEYLLWGWSKGGNYYVTCVDKKRRYVRHRLFFWENCAGGGMNQWSSTCRGRGDIYVDG